MALCLLAAVRVFVYSAAFPFFNNIDEQAHFDLVVKYSHLEIPRTLERMSPESCRYMALYASPEYFRSPLDYPGGEIPPPLWTMPEETRRAVLGNLAGCESRINHESSQAPLYYALAALWLRAGRLCGLAGGVLLYWIRFLNVGLAAALVWLGYIAAKQTFPGERFVRLGVPLLLAVLPQDVYYAIQNDVLSPICFGLAFLGLLCWLRSEKPGAMLSIGTGLALAAVCLVKVSNLPLLAVAAVAVLVPVRRWAKSGKLTAGLPSLALVLLSAGLPIGLWVWWNLANFGDATASAAKIEMLGWTHKPIAQWWPHPIFTPSGFAYFWSHLLPMFWRGELVWDLQRLASPAVDAFYWIASALLAGAAVISLLPRFSSSENERTAVILAASSFFASVAYLGLLSIALDFGNSFYPSRVLPYFISGRLMLGALIPFLLLYLHGLDWAARRLRCPVVRWWLLAAMAILMAGSQLVLDRVAFASAYNWFHLVGKG